LNNQDTRGVYIVQHVREDDDIGGSAKIIGIYSTKQLATAAVEKAKVLPGFSKHTNGFSIDEYKLDEDCWQSGFGIDEC
jgi:hypothetical protein